MICVVDDDACVLKGVERLLRSAGFTILTFGNPKDFLEHAHKHPVSVAVLDVWMPEMSGLDVQRQLREFSPSTYVIVITAKGDPEVRDLAIKGGASAYFTKPFDDEELLGAIRIGLATSSAK